VKKRPSSTNRQSRAAKAAAAAAERAAENARQGIIDVEATEIDLATGAPKVAAAKKGGGNRGEKDGLSAAKLKSLVQTLRNSLDPAAMQWVMACSDGNGCRWLRQS
jgi:hypothetical protein